MQNMQKWDRTEEFYEEDGSRAVIYTNQLVANRIRRSIYIGINPDGILTLIYEHPPPKLMKLMQDPLQQEFNEKYKIEISGQSLAIFRLKKGDKNFLQLLNLIHQYDSIDEIRYELEVCLGLRHSEEEISKSLSDLTDVGDLKGAVQKAKDYQSKGYTGVVWALATSFEEAWVDPALIIDLCQSIPPHDPDFKEANGRLYGLCALKPGEAPTIPHLVQQLKYAFNSGVQTLFDRAYQALSNKYNSLTLKLKGLQLNDIETLIAIGLDKREESEDNAKLREENIKLKKQVEELELQVAKLQSTLGPARGADPYPSNMASYGGLFATSSTTTATTTATILANGNPPTAVTTTTNAGFSTTTTTTTTAMTTTTPHSYQNG